MAFVPGYQGYFSLNDGSQLRNLSSFLTGVEFPRERVELETTTLGSGGDREFIGGLRGASGSLTGHWDPTVTTGPDEILDGAYRASGTRAFEYGPEGNGSGKVKYSGSVVVTSYQTGSQVEGLTPFTANYRISGAVTRGTFA